MRFCLRALAIAALGLALGVPAAATTIVFSGQGTVGTLQGTLPRNAAATVGNPFQFSFSFDTASLALLDGDDQGAFYDLPVTDFVATIGGYAFTLSAEPGFEPVLAIGRGFTFFDQPFSEPALIATFNFASARATGAADATPFATGAGAYGALAINAFFRADFGDTGVGVDQLRNPIDADKLNFSYTTRDPVTRRTGAILGAYTGSFASAAAVPEPAGWALMLVGFATLGAGLRTRRRIVSYA